MFLRCFSGGGVDAGVGELVAVVAPVDDSKEKRTVAVNNAKIVFTVLFNGAYRLDRALVPGREADKSAF